MTSPSAPIRIHIQGRSEGIERRQGEHVLTQNHVEAVRPELPEARRRGCRIVVPTPASNEGYKSPDCECRNPNPVVSLGQPHLSFPIRRDGMVH